MNCGGLSAAISTAYELWWPICCNLYCLWTVVAYLLQSLLLMNCGSLSAAISTAYELWWPICCYLFCLWTVVAYLQQSLLLMNCGGLSAAISTAYELSDFVTCASCIFCTYFCLWDAKFLFQRVPWCNSIANLSLKTVFWTHKFAVGTHWYGKQRVPGLISPKL